MPNGFTFEQLRACAEREVAQRERVYPKLIERDRMSKHKAEREIAMMRAIAQHLQTQEQGSLL